MASKQKIRIVDENPKQKEQIVYKVKEIYIPPSQDYIALMSLILTVATPEALMNFVSTKDDAIILANLLGVDAHKHLNNALTDESGKKLPHFLKLVLDDARIQYYEYCQNYLQENRERLLTCL